MSKLSPGLERSLNTLIQLKEDQIRMKGGEGVKMPTGNYPYLLSEDAAFARAFRLSEDEALELFGGLKGYTQHRLDRSKARSAGLAVPPLSDNIEEHLEGLKFTDTTEQQWAGHLVSEQMTKVAGCLGGLKATKELRALSEKDTKDAAALKAVRIKELCEESANRSGWSPDSQSARDWAQAEYKRRWSK